jgi:hypothetical protein
LRKFTVFYENKPSYKLEKQLKTGRKNSALELKSKVKWKLKISGILRKGMENYMKIRKK